jgi:hypothetical protein
MIPEKVAAFTALDLRKYLTNGSDTYIETIITRYKRQVLQKITTGYFKKKYKYRMLMSLRSYNTCKS